MDTAKQGPYQNVATEIVRQKLRVAETTEKDVHPKPRKDGKERGPGLSLANWKPLTGYTKPWPPKVAGLCTVSGRPPKRCKLNLKILPA